jgi:hypothetical protein
LIEQFAISEKEEEKGRAQARRRISASLFKVAQPIVPRDRARRLFRPFYLAMINCSGVSVFVVIVPRYPSPRVLAVSRLAVTSKAVFTIPTLINSEASELSILGIDECVFSREGLRELRVRC